MAFPFRLDGDMVVCHKILPGALTYKFWDRNINNLSDSDKIAKPELKLAMNYQKKYYVCKNNVGGKKCYNDIDIFRVSW